MTASGIYVEQASTFRADHEQPVLDIKIHSSNNQPTRGSSSWIHSVQLVGSLTYRAFLTITIITRRE